MGPLRGSWIDVARDAVEAGLAALEGRLDEAVGAATRSALPDTTPS